MNFAVLVFPGSNCDIDCFKAVVSLGEAVEYVWHSETDLSKYDCILLPGGFSYGDYLRTGAIATKSNVMNALLKAAGEGKYILGICNGFQILTESGLLPGALIRNKGMKFCCQAASLHVVNNETPFTRDYKKGEEINIPVAHGEGNYYCDEKTLQELKSNHQIVFRYKTSSNPNGSLYDIAGICNPTGRILGMMPHPERAVHEFLGSTDGVRLFTSILKTWKESYDSAAIC